MDEIFEIFDPAINEPKLRSDRCRALLRYWNGLRGTRAMPTPGEIDPAALKDVLPHVMMVGISYDPFRVFYRLVGTEVVRFAKFDFTGCYLDTLVFEPPYEKDGTAYYREAVAAKRPAYGVTYWMVEETVPRWIEFVICPLSSDGNTIDRCIVIEDYEPLKYFELDSLPPVQKQSLKSQRVQERRIGSPVAPVAINPCPQSRKLR
ncbi:MAG TPA: PAS domain-containing protein [Dongiaceae bacterium]|jgi:hypothetical protein